MIKEEVSILPKRSIIEREEFKETLVRMGYAPSEKGFKVCIRESLKVMTASELGRRLDISKICLVDWMRRLKVKNPNKPGGNNNPDGCYGKKAVRRNMKDGCIWRNQ